MQLHHRTSPCRRLCWTACSSCTPASPTPLPRTARARRTWRYVLQRCTCHTAVSGQAGARSASAAAAVWALAGMTGACSCVAGWPWALCTDQASRAAFATGLPACLPSEARPCMREWHSALHFAGHLLHLHLVPACLPAHRCAYLSARGAGGEWPAALGGFPYAQEAGPFTRAYRQAFKDLGEWCVRDGGGGTCTRTERADLVRPSQ